MARPRQVPLDDCYEKIQISDYSGGLATAIGALSLASNQFPAALNVIHLPGRLLFRGGYTITASLPGPADAAYYFKDSDGDEHYAVWSDGGLYDCIAGNAVVIEAACYTAGQNIGAVADDGVLYWSTGLPVPVPIRYWNPVAGTFGQLAGNLIPAGSVNPPASDFLILYQGCIVALAPFWGSPLVTDRSQPIVFCWADVNDPTTWIAANSYQVGSNNGGRLEYGRQFGISADGITPTQTLMIFRNDEGVYAYSGALSQLHEQLLNCDVGMKDRQSAQYLPTNGEFGVVIWLGRDGQFWKTNGVNCLPISAATILPTLSTAYYSALLEDPDTRFPSGYNEQWQYYFCSVGGIQFVYRWPVDSWTLFQGWPVGPTFIAPDENGLPALFAAAHVPFLATPFQLDSSELGSNDVLSDSPSQQQVYALTQIARIGFSDLGVMPSVYWASPVLHGGDFNLFKMFHWASITTLDTGVLYNVVGRSVRRSDGSVMVTKTMPLQAPLSQGAPFILGQSVLGGSDVLSDPLLAALSPGSPVSMQCRLSVPIPVSEWWPAGMNELLQGNAMQLIVSYGGGANAFDLLGSQIDYISRGYRRGSGTFYNPEALTDLPFDVFLPTFPTS